jgi:hypothetical protein
VSRHGHAFIDRALYLPKDRVKDPARSAAAHVPEGVRFATRPRLALGMAGRAIAAGVPFAWVAADTVHGTGEVEMTLRRAGKGHVLGTDATQPFDAWIGEPGVSNTAEEIARALAPSAWKRLSAGEGARGPRPSDWACLEFADLEADEFNEDIRFPELYRLHALAGARLLLVPAAFTLHTGRDHWELLLRARAVENQCFVIGAGQFGESVPGKACNGRSMIVDPWGTVLACAADGAGVVVADLDLGRQQRLRAELPSLANRRADVYALEARGADG